MLAGLQAEDLGLLLADHVEKAVHLALLLGFKLLVQLSQAGRALMVRAMRPWGPATGGWALLLHLSRRWHGWVVEVEVHSDA